MPAECRRKGHRFCEHVCRHCGCTWQHVIKMTERCPWPADASCACDGCPPERERSQSHDESWRHDRDYDGEQASAAEWEREMAAACATGGLFWGDLEQAETSSTREQGQDARTPKHQAGGTFEPRTR